MVEQKFSKLKVAGSSPVTRSNKIKTPCIKQCKLSPCKTFCIACKRTIQEIVEAGKSKQNTLASSSTVEQWTVNPSVVGSSPT